MLHDIREDSFSNGITMHGLAIEIWIIWIFRAIKEQFMNYFSENSSVCGIVMSPKSPHPFVTDHVLQTVAMNSQQD